MGSNIGVKLLKVVMLKEAVVAQRPADGVNVYVTVPAMAVLIVAGLQVPVIPSFEVRGSIGAVEFWQSGPMALNVGVTMGFTCNTITFEVTGPVAQGTLDVTTQLIASLLEKLLLLYTRLFVPTFWPFNIHW